MFILIMLIIIIMLIFLKELDGSSACTLHRPVGKTNRLSIRMELTSESTESVSIFDLICVFDELLLLLLFLL